ncbi:Dynein beta chain, ciliary-like 3 [Homarus americanus]|uniref:Dynein beta chain, ciliary-like 3 n=1 Tax=Homarus americanus TaxID=6706 RepID=A0A8J5JK18_HOMAM|nr:Dynein beta chain, ciliary-like 3 [Homarus americanus]
MAGAEGDRENWDVLGEYSNKTLRLKADRWIKAVQNEDTRSTLLNFFDSDSELVIIPMLENPANRNGWPEMVCEDVSHQLYALRGTVYRMGEMTDSQLKSAIEGVVIKWVHQVEEVLTQDTEDLAGPDYFPKPLEEILFWGKRRENLTHISNQLRDKKVRMMSNMLEVTESAYYPAFCLALVRPAAVEEARDVMIHLTPLKPLLEGLEAGEFQDAPPLIPPLMHCICLLWATCPAYRKPDRIVTLFREITNLLISMNGDSRSSFARLQGRNFIGTVGFQAETTEPLQKINTCVSVLKTFRDSFQEHREKVHSYFKEEERPRRWEFHPTHAFSRMDQFLSRLANIKEIFDVAKEFLKIEKVEFGGPKGKVLGANISSVFSEFNEAYTAFSIRTYDCLDPAEDAFDEGHQQFKRKVTELEQRLSLIVKHALQESQSPESYFKELFEQWQQGTTVLQDEDGRPEEVFEDDDVVQMRGKDDDPYSVPHRYFPPVVGKLKCLREVNDRVAGNMQTFSQLSHPLVSSEEGVSLQRQWQEVQSGLEEYMKKVVEEWRALASADYTHALSQPILQRRHDSTIAVNFSSELVRALQELRYVWVVGEGVKDGAELASCRSTFRKYTTNLQLVTDWYNHIRINTNDVEFNLIKQEMDDIDETILRSEKELTWNSEGVWEYIEVLRDSVSDLENRVQKAQANVRRLDNILATWIQKPIFERRDGKRDTLLNLDDKAERLKKVYSNMERDGAKISAMVEENKALLKVPDTSRHWDRYLLFLDHMITRGLVDAASCSLFYLLDNCESRVNQFPLLEARLELHDTHLNIRPTLEELRGLAETLVNDILYVSTLVPRLVTHIHPTYLPDVEKDEEIVELKETLLGRFQVAASKTTEHRDQFLQHQALWKDRRSDVLDKFLTSGDDGVQPSLPQFRQQIDRYEALYTELEAIETTVVFDKWFRLDVRPFKHSLLENTKKWARMYKQHLISQVTDRLTELDKFIKETEIGVAQDLGNGDYDILVSIMAHLVAVRDRIHSTDAMFEPIKATIALVRQYGDDLPETMHLKLQKQCDLVRQHVAPLKANEVNGIRKKCMKFETRQAIYRDKFKTYSFFNFDCELTYWRLERVNSRVQRLEEEMRQLQESAALFEVVIPEFKFIKACRKELRMLKQLWDHICLVRACVNHWKTTPWREVDVENMDIETMQGSNLSWSPSSNPLLPSLRPLNQAKLRGIPAPLTQNTLDKEMRSWDAYINLDSTVKNMLTSLRAVAELQNPSLRERHWGQLLVATKTESSTKNFVANFVDNPETTLADLLQLNLHTYEDEVKNIVDKAVKEMSMEKIIKELDVTWATMEFMIDKHPRTGVALIRTSEEMIETLEENQVQLQNLMTSKYIEHFLEEVSMWQNKLSIADQVITLWFEVQRTWSYLESIFIGSDDIRRQLPEDSARFDQIDIDFKELVAEMVANPHVLLATNRQGLFSGLEALQAELTLCEKTLAEYLETKRLAFPRFYFVSTADLLDILSNGNQPVKVTRHLTKLFDSIACLKFSEGDSTDASTAVGMTAKDGEYVEFCSVTKCVGPVEKWLMSVLEVMRATVQARMTDAVVAYEDRPRDQWVGDYPAQVALTGTQIYWTVEATAAFSRLEEGYENALRDYYRKQVQQLNALISLLLGELTRQQRQKIMTICTIDVHARDVVARLISGRVESAAEFAWQSQLRHRWDEQQGDCFVDICDARMKYDHEYLGNTTRLVITPLTDRCYITLTQSLHLVMGGAPSGPAGTGKTETTKDLGRALGMMVYVFNCSEQMDYKVMGSATSVTSHCFCYCRLNQSCGNIYKGLAQTGAWGCFDEFNRISVEVLSVVAVQVKSVQVSQSGEVFRPCAMVVPDLELICEIMLVAEGFIEAKVLARKFITLYRLCRELLSKQGHYDWGLRAIKSLLVVAGSLKRDDPERPEDQVLMRALRDYNVPKIVTDDVPVFMGLIGDLFPALDVPRKKDLEFEKAVKEAAVDLKLQPEDSFILKVVQLKELLEVRHSVFIIGGAGTGKTQVWRTLFRTMHNMKKKPICFDLNPKAVTRDELFGYINSATREWKDGLFSSLMRDQANMPGDAPKWIILDGDIDPMWIESLNTLMDDNKVETYIVLEFA